jgi:hypothetical protein
MRRVCLFLCCLIALTFNAHLPTTAQDERLDPGDPPIAARITVEPPDANGIVRVVGAQGSVYSNATVAIRNLYTGETVYAQAGGFGSFAASIFGPGATPFLISPSLGGVPDARRAQPGSLPGGPATIVYGSAPLPDPGAIITRIAIDGDVSDWALYPGTSFETTRALLNTESLYIAVDGVDFTDAYDRLELVFTLDTTTYGIRFDPRRIDVPLLRRLNPNAAEIGALAAAYRLEDGQLEARIPLPFVERVLRVTFDAVRWLAPDGSEVGRVEVPLTPPLVDEIDGIVRPTPNDPQMLRDALDFDAGGSFGDGFWAASGRAWQRGRVGTDALRLSAGDRLSLAMDARLVGVDLPLDARLLVTLRLLPAIVDDDGTLRPVSDAGTNFGWTSVVTASGLPVDNVTSVTSSASALVEPHEFVRSGDAVLFPLDISLNAPNLPDGLYIPLLQGEIVLPDQTSAEIMPQTRLPLVVNLGEVNAVDLPLVWALFFDTPSDGARGLLAREADGALSNRVRFNPPTYILPPRYANGDAIPYVLEPYLPTQFPNRSDATFAPLIPLRLPGGQITVRITRPDDTSDDLGVQTIAQAAASTAAFEESALFGTTAPLDAYRLTTLNPALTGYIFDQYGEYEIDLRGELQDVFGNRYIGGGTYRVLVAELLDLLPAVLPGTPFETGDVFHPGAHIYPGIPAELTVRLTVYPLDGSAALTQTFSGRANRFGVFVADAEAFTFETPGEYVVEYEARYQANDGRLWAASLRAAGVIAARDERDWFAHGARTVIGADGSRIRRAWYDAATLALPTPLQTYFPYHSGDILWFADESSARVRPAQHVREVGLAYQRWLAEQIAPDAPIDGVTLARRAVEGELPVGITDRDSSSYAYLSAARPGGMSRQLIDGSLTALDPGWTPNDPFNLQIGAGLNGDQPGDYTFLFGGTIIREGEVRAAAIYGALLVTIAPDDPRGVRVFPPARGADGAGDGGALLTVRNQEVTTFLHLTGVRPGDIYEVGDTFALSGQIAPPLASLIRVEVISPRGVKRTLGGTANRIGYYYNPEDDFRFDEAGVWMVEVQVEHRGSTSAGDTAPPYPSGGVLGGQMTRFPVYVLASDTDLLEWNSRLTDALIPPAVAYNFNFTLPQGWSELEAYYTLSTPGYIIEEGEIRLSGRSFTYLYNPSTLRERFNFLENVTRAPAQLGDDRAYVTDQRMLTFYASGIDSNGIPRALARSFVLWYDRLISLEG